MLGWKPACTSNRCAMPGASVALRPNGLSSLNSAIGPPPSSQAVYGSVAIACWRWRSHWTSVAELSKPGPNHAGENTPHAVHSESGTQMSVGPHVIEPGAVSLHAAPPISHTVMLVASGVIGKCDTQLGIDLSTLPRSAR